MRSENIKNIAFFVLFFLFSLCPASLLYMTTDDIPAGDALENVMIGHSFFMNGIAHDGPEAKIQAGREPLYPLLLAEAMTFSWDQDFETWDFSCFKKEKLCPGIIAATKKINWLFHGLATIAAGLIVLWLTGRKGLALVAMGLLSTNTGMMTAANNWLTEPQALFFLLLHSAFLYGTFSGARPLLHAIGAGITLALLILTKALFIYLLYLYALAAFVSVWRYRDAAKYMAALCIMAAMLILPWMARTYINTSSFSVINTSSFSVTESGRGGEVLAIRAEYDTMPWSDILPAFIYFTPGFGEDLVKDKFGQDVHDRFSRTSKKSYYRRSKNAQGLAHEIAKRENISLQSAAFKVIKQNWLKHIVLTPVFTYEGLFIPRKVYFDNGAPPLFKPLTKVVNTLALSLTLASLVYMLRKRKYAYLPLFVPGLYSFVFHSFLTHNWPRYSLPLLAAALVCICLAWHLRKLEAMKGKPA